MSNHNHLSNFKNISQKSFDTEISILSILINEEVNRNSNSFIECEEMIDEKYFSNKVFKDCYKIIIDILEESEDTKVTPSLIIAKASILGVSNINASLLERIISVPINGLDITSLLKILTEFYLERKVIEVSNSVNSIARSSIFTSQDKIEKVMSEIVKLEDRKSLIKDKDSLMMANEFLEDLDKNFNRKEDLRGLSLGLKSIDEMTSGAEPGQLWLIAGRPGMGKTAFVLHVMRTNLEKGAKGLFYSLEMPSNEITMRMVSNIGNIPIWKIKNPRKHYDPNIDWNKTNIAIDKISKFNFNCYDQSNLNINELIIHAKSHKRKYGLDFIAIDYLQLMGSSNGNYDRYAIISEITRKLKILARDLNIPIFLLSQLNRNLEQRPNKRPMPSDLRESGSIEQDADVIIFLYRDEVYNEQSQYKGYGEIIIGKQRNGATGTSFAKIDLSMMKFNDLDEQDMNYLSSIENGSNFAQKSPQNNKYERGF